MPTNGLDDPHGKGKRKLHHETANVSDGGTLDTGLQSIDHAVAESEANDAGTTLSVDSVASTSGGVITFDSANPDGTAGGASNTTAHDVTAVAVGE